MPELNYKASNIARVERELDANFFATLESIGEGTPSVNSVLILIQSGGLSEKEADKMLEEKGIEGTIQAIVDALSNAGFLGKSTEVEKEMKQIQSSKAKPSQTSGKKTNG